jgi:hypothetical protein
MNDCGQANWQRQTNDEVDIRVPDVEHMVLLAEFSMRLGLEAHMPGRAKKTVSFRSRDGEITSALAETRRVVTDIAVAPLRSLVGVLKGAALRMPPTLMALLERTKLSLAVANNRSSHGVDVAPIAGGLEDVQ